MNHDHTIPLYEAEILHRHGAAGRNAGGYETLDPDVIVPGMEPSWLIEGLMPASVLAVADGLPRCGKSFPYSSARPLLQSAPGQFTADTPTLAIYLVESGAVPPSRLIVSIAWKAAS